MTMVPPDSKNPTVFEVARHAGVSAMTVSRVLAGSTRVAPQTRERVLLSLKTLGYRRNDVARALRGQRSGLIGVVISDIDNPYYAQFFLGVEERVHESGRRILLGNAAEQADREAQVVADFLAWQVEGLIAIPAGAGEHWQPDQLCGVPVVFASRIIPSIDTDSVRFDDLTAARQVTELLLSRGHRRIGFLGNSDATSSGRHRFLGYQQAHEAAGVIPDPALAHRDSQSGADAMAAALGLLELRNPPTALFATNNRYGLALIRAVHKVHGRSQCGQLTIAVFDPFDLSELVPWPLITVANDAREMGRQAATMLFQRLDAGEHAAKVAQHVLLQPTLNIQGSETEH